MKTQTIYCLISDNGDGSCSTHWFRSKKKVDELLDENDSFWGPNEGGPSDTLTFPADLDLEAAGFIFDDEDEES